MKSKILILALALTVFGACNKKESDTQKASEEPKVKEFFNIDMDVTADAADDFVIYFSEDSTNVFVDKQTIWKGVKGGNEMNNLVFDFPEDAIPTNIRIDFGIKKEKNAVTLHNLKLNYYDKSLNIKGSDFLNYFIVNPVVTTTPDPAKGTMTFVHNGESKEGSYYFPRQELINEIYKLTK